MREVNGLQAVFVAGAVALVFFFPAAFQVLQVVVKVVRGGVFLRVQLAHHAAHGFDELGKFL